jgi:ADP-ribose pyrophosphatase YjhB (NUDIX family)
MATSRDYPTRPFLGVSALVESSAGILLIKRGKPPLAGLWSLPGGIVETGERLEEAIIREMAEETGLDFTPHCLADIAEIIRPDQTGKTQRHYVIAVYYGDSEPLPLHAGDDASDARWVLPEELTNYPMTDGTLDVIHQILRQNQTRL